MQTQKKVMLLVPMLHQGGFERICVMTAELLKERYEVYLVVFNAEDTFYDVSGLNVIDLKLGSVDSKFGKMLNIIKRVRAVRKWKKKLGIAVSYSFGTTANIVNVLSKVQDKTWAGIRGYGAVDDSGIAMICRKADRVVCCTKVMEEEFCRRFQVKASATLYNPCDVKQIGTLSQEENPWKQHPFFEKEGKIIVSMGREDDLKGFWHLVKSFSIVKKTITDARLLIIGDGTYTEYKRLAKDLGIAEDVLFAGAQKNPFILLSLCDIYALTSESEGFPNALIEAMACGLPCVSVNCKTGPAEILQENYLDSLNQAETYYGDYGILTPIFIGEKNLNAQCITTEEEIFASEIIHIFSDEELFNSYHEKVKKRASHFSIDAYLNDITGMMEIDT